MSTNELAAMFAELLKSASSDDVNVKEAKNYRNVSLERWDKANIALPRQMPLPDARAWLKKIEDDDKSEIALDIRIPCFPLDGARAVLMAMTELYGYSEQQATPSFFGPKPPLQIQMAVGVDQFENVPWGRIQPMGMNGYIELSAAEHEGLQAIRIGGTIMKKSLGMANAIADRTRTILRERSVYKGHAIRVDLGYMNPAKRTEFDPSKHQPTFMDVKNITADDLIVPAGVEIQLVTDIWARIERTEQVSREGNIPLKHGVILSGKYGTGKTLTSKLTAKKCEDNGWTFIYLTASDDLAAGLRFAQLYAPAVLFAEDIDRAVEGQVRTKSIDEILNTIDGVDTKNLAVITVLTTNHPELINQAFLRAGRVDNVIEFQTPDAPTAERFLIRFLGRSIKPSEDLKEVSGKFAGMIPAFIAEATNKAKLFALYQTGSMIGTVSAAHLSAAADAMQSHINMVEGRKAEALDGAIELIHAIRRTEQTVRELDNDMHRLKNRLDVD